MPINVAASCDWAYTVQNIGYDATDFKVAIGWTATETFTIDSVVVGLSKFGSPTGNITIEIWNDDSGSPGSLITNGTSNTFDVSTLHALNTAVAGDNDCETIEFTWATPPTLTNGNVYYFVITPSWTPSTSNYARVARRGTVTVSGWTAWEITSGGTETSISTAFWCMIRKAGTPTYPQWSGFGGLCASDNVSSIDVEYPKTINANDILFATLFTDANEAYSTPSGWNLAESYLSSAHTAYLFWKRAAGTESGTQTFSGSTNHLRGGKIWRFDNCITSGTPYEDITEANGSGSPITVSSITTTGSNELGVCFMSVEDNPTVSPIASPVWNEIGEGISATGTDLGQAAYYLHIPSATTTDASTITLWANDLWVSWTLALFPSGTTTHDLTVQDGAHAHAADSPTYSVVNQLVPADAAHAHAADSPALTLISSLVLADAAHAHYADEPVLSAVAVLVLADALHAHAADEPTLGYTAVLDTADALHAHIADEVPIIRVYQLLPNDCDHFHAADPCTPSLVSELDLQDALHAHTAENVDLVSVGVLSVANALHSHEADSPVPSLITTLSLEDTAHAHAADEVGIFSTLTLAIADSVHATGSDEPVISFITDLELQGASHAHAADEPDLSVVQFLVIADALHAHAAEAPSLSALTSLTVADAAHALTSEEPTLTSIYSLRIPGGNLLVNSGLETNIPYPYDWAGWTEQKTDPGYIGFADDGGLWNTGFATVNSYDAMSFGDNGASISQEAANPTFGTDALYEFAFYLGNGRIDYEVYDVTNSTVLLSGTQTHPISTPFVKYRFHVEIPADCATVRVTMSNWSTGSQSSKSGYVEEVTLGETNLHAHAADNLTLGYVAFIATIDDALHAHAAEAPTYSVVNQLAVNECLHAQYADNLTLFAGSEVEVASALHGHTAENLTLTAVRNLEPADALHGHLADEPDLDVIFFLVIADALHGHSGENLDIGLVTGLEIYDGTHAHFADEPSLISIYVLAPADAHHGHTADEPELISEYELAIANALHGHEADGVTVTSLVFLEPLDCWHNHVADPCQVEIAGQSDLAIQSCHHSHYADDLFTMQVVYILEVADTLHAHSAGAVLIEHNQGVTIHQRMGNIALKSKLAEAALLDLAPFFASDPATSVLASPAENDEAVHAADAFIRLTYITTPSAGTFSFDFRINGTYEVTLEIDSTLTTVRLLEDGVERINLGSASIGTGDDVTLIFNGSRVELWVSEGMVGSYNSLTDVSGTGAKLNSLGTGGGIWRAEFYPLTFPAIPHYL
jgi:hypothetical protein